MLSSSRCGRSLLGLSGRSNGVVSKSSDVGFLLDNDDDRLESRVKSKGNFITSISLSCIAVGEYA